MLWPRVLKWRRAEAFHLRSSKLCLPLSVRGGWTLRLFPFPGERQNLSLWNSLFFFSPFSHSFHFSPQSTFVWPHFTKFPKVYPTHGYYPDIPCPTGNIRGGFLKMSYWRPSNLWNKDWIASLDKETQTAEALAWGREYTANVRRNLLISATPL